MLRRRYGSRIFWDVMCSATGTPGCAASCRLALQILAAPDELSRFEEHNIFLVEALRTFLVPLSAQGEGPSESDFREQTAHIEPVRSSRVLGFLCCWPNRPLNAGGSIPRQPAVRSAHISTRDSIAKGS